MKLRTWVLVVACFLMFVSLASQGQTRVTANVPFEFNVGNRAAPAGQYDVLPATPFTRGVIQLSNAPANTEHFKTFLIPKTERSKLDSSDSTPKFVFRVYGDRYFLSEIWFSGDSGASMPITNVERQVARNWHNAPETAVVLARK